MDFASILLIILGLALFETVTSIDNAIINAEWFLTWGLLVAVFALRGLLPFFIVWAVNPSVGPIGAITATFSNDPHVVEEIESSAPVLLVGGGIFMVFIFFHWLFLEPKNFGLKGERFIFSQGVWFYAVVSIILATIVWFALHISQMMAFGAVVGSTVFFITHGFKENAQKAEKDLLKSKTSTSDWSKILYLEAIDGTFSIDGVLGAFAFTVSVPLILIGNGIGAFVVRELTLRNIENIKKYAYLKNGAMYSVFFLGLIMILHSFGFNIPEWFSPIVTASVVGFFFLKSKRALAKA
ncbi:DUF475 domain-containing protein [Candidatus Daviesbacteria bacterium]|nr:DUF475 domain-containing protein [Candidatus Daviesbacteria bacterium]